MFIIEALNVDLKKIIIVIVSEYPHITQIWFESAHSFNSLSKVACVEFEAQLCSNTIGQHSTEEKK